MMLDWNQYRQQLLKGIAELGRHTPGTARGYRELSQAGAQTARLDGKTRELIAIAVGVTRQCDGCITFRGRRHACKHIGIRRTPAAASNANSELTCVPSNRSIETAGPNTTESAIAPCRAPSRRVIRHLGVAARRGSRFLRCRNSTRSTNGAAGWDPRDRANTLAISSGTRSPRPSGWGLSRQPVPPTAPSS